MAQFAATVLATVAVMLIERLIVRFIRTLFLPRAA
jgi:hypothetical protein